MRRKLLIGGGALLLAAALCLTVYNLAEDRRAGENAVRVVGKIRSETSWKTPPPPPESEAPDPLPAYLLDPAMEMPVEEIDGHGYIGTLEIPTLELTLPVMDQWSYPGLKLAPCRYSGSAYLDDLVVAGHNYRSHFGHLYTLRAGDAVLFTDVEGNAFSYRVAELEQLPPTAVEEMEGGGWALTLFTCANGGKARLAVRCARSAESSAGEAR